MWRVGVSAREVRNEALAAAGASVICSKGEFAGIARVLESGAGLKEQGRNVE